MISEATDLLPILAQLTKYRAMIDSHWDDIDSLLSNHEFREIFAQKREQDALPNKLGFNLFRIISDTYYRENFHSDVLKALLDPNESHRCGYAPLHLFIKYLKILRPDLHGLNIEDFRNSIVEREPGRIDILIQDLNSKKAIIIENKINGAGDMDRQLPRYVDYLENKDIQPVAIVYLTLNQLKQPSEQGWKPVIDHNRIYPILVKAIAFSHDSPSLINGWISECENCVQDFNTLAILKQYKSLIQHLGSHAMNETLMRKFYDTLITPDLSNWENACALATLMADLPAYRARNIVRNFENNFSPFEDVWVYSNTTAVFSFKKGKNISIDIACSDTNKYSLLFWDRESANHGSTRIDRALDSFSLKDKFSWDSDQKRYYINYSFPKDENILFHDLNLLLQHLRTIMPKSKEVQING
ncbi:MAG: PD-(D/E)XK nuclease family protein [Luteolibacter sp.]